MDRRAFVKKWTPSPLTLILLGLIAYLWFRPPADVSDENRAVAPWQVTLTDGRLLTGDALRVEVVSISVDDPPDKIAAWMKDKGYVLPAAPTNPSVAAAFGSVTSVPTSFILDAAGHIRHKIAGQVYYARLDKLVTPLLKAS